LDGRLRKKMFRRSPIRAEVGQDGMLEGMGLDIQKFWRPQNKPLENWYSINQIWVFLIQRYFRILEPETKTTVRKGFPERVREFRLMLHLDPL
jgi:hypothetical protein